MLYQKRRRQDRDGIYIPVLYLLNKPSARMRSEGYGSRTVCVCVCLCVQAAHLRLTQLSDKLDILTDLVSCWLQNEFGFFRIMASFRR